MVGAPNLLIAEVSDSIPGMVNLVNDFCVIYLDLGVLGSIPEFAVVYFSKYRCN